VDTGLSACILRGKDVNVLETFASDCLPSSGHWANGASGAGGGGCAAENCPVHFTKGRTLHLDGLSAAIRDRGVFVELRPLTAAGLGPVRQQLRRPSSGGNEL